jgi:deazaflavin-dependent oxidoreductase (nitroreductase family)
MPNRLARFNRIVTNRLARPIAGRVPPLALIGHVGRITGTPYRTPVLIFRDDERWFVAVIYGAGSDWVRNALAAGACDVMYRGHAYRMDTLEVIAAEPSDLPLPAPVKAALRLIGTRRFLLMQGVETASSRVPASG